MVLHSMQREYAGRSLKAETTELAARDNTQRGTDDTRQRYERRHDSSLLFCPLACFLSSHVLSQHECSANCQHIRVQITTTLHVLSPQLSVSVTHIHVAQKTAGVSSFILPRIAHRECHRRRQSWVPCGFERRPFVGGPTSMQDFVTARPVTFLS